MSVALYYIEINLICLVIIGILFFSVAKVDKGKRDFFYRLLLIAAAVTCISDGVAGSLKGMVFPGAKAILYTANILFFLSSFLISICWFFYSLDVLFGKINKTIFTTVVVLSSIAGLIFILAPVTGWAFTIDENNLYHRGPLVWLHWVVTFPAMLIPSVIAPFTKAEKTERRAISAFIIIPCLATILQAVVYGISCSQAGITGGLILIYAMFQSKAVAGAELKAKLLDEISNTDTLTGLRNRRAYDMKIEESKSKEWIGTVFADINGLKSANDTLGHKAGDNLICEFSDFLREYFSEDEVYRTGGDEFVIISTDRNAFQEKVDNLFANLKERGSAGFAEGTGEDILSLLKNAEKNMYKEKAEYYARHGIDRRK